MKRAIKNYSGDFIAMVVLALIAIFVGGFILSNQRFYLPGWVPFVGTNFYTLNAEFQTAQAISPGQGQTVAMAGVPVGEISQVQLKNGRALVTMNVESKYGAYIHQNASILTRPKTGLNDMLLQLNPGTAAAPKAPDGFTIPVARTSPNVNPDEFLAALDTSTRNYLKLLIGGAGQGLTGNRQELAAVFKRFDPLARDTAKFTRLLAQRHALLSTNIHNLGEITAALAGNDKDLAAFVDSSNAVFKVFASQDQNLTATLSELPTALNATNQAVISANKLGQQLGPTLAALQPFARNLAPASIASQDFFNATTNVVKTQLRPFAVDVQPTVANLKPATSDLAAASPDLTTSVAVLNTLFNTIAYNPTPTNDKKQGYLFYLGWLNHLGPLGFTNQDALGPVRRGVFLLDCENSKTVKAIKEGFSGPLGTLSNLINTPSSAQICGTPTRSTRSVAKAKSATVSSSGGGTQTQGPADTTSTASAPLVDTTSTPTTTSTDATTPAPTLTTTPPAELP